MGVRTADKILTILEGLHLLHPPGQILRSSSHVRPPHLIPASATAVVAVSAAGSAVSAAAATALTASTSVPRHPVVCGKKAASLDSRAASRFTVSQAWKSEKYNVTNVILVEVSVSLSLFVSGTTDTGKTCPDNDWERTERGERSRGLRGRGRIRGRWRSNLLVFLRVRRFFYTFRQGKTQLRHRKRETAAQF